MKSLFTKLKSRITTEVPGSLETHESSPGSLGQNIPEPADAQIGSAVPKPDPGILRRPVRSTLKPGAPAWLTRNSASPTGSPETKSPEKETRQKVAMELGDFIRRIPPDLLSEGPHDLTQRVWFKISDLSANVAQGKPTIPLSQIARMCPELFIGEITPDRDAEIYFPWNKLVAEMRAASLNQDDKTTEEFQGIASPPPQKRSVMNRRAPVTESVAPSTNQPRGEETPKPPVASLKTRWQNRAAQTPSAPPAGPASAFPAEQSKTPSPAPSQDFVLLRNTPASTASDKDIEELSQKLTSAQTQVESLNAMLEKLTTERDGALAQVAEARSSAKAQSDVLAGQHQQQTEALIRERDSANQQRDEALAQFNSEREILNREVARLTKERGQLLSDHSGASSQMSKLAADQQTLRSERDALSRQKDEALTQSLQTKQSLENELASFRVERDAAARLRDETAAQLDGLRAEKESAIRSMQKAAESAERQIEKLVSERDTLSKQHNEIHARLTEAREALATKLGEQQALTKQREESRAELDQLRATHEQQIAALKHELDDSRSQNENIAARLTQSSENARQQIERLVSERDSVSKQHNETQAQLAEAREALAVKLDSLSEHQALAARQREESLAELARLRTTQEKQIAALAEECDTLREEKRTVLARFAQGTDAAQRQIDALTAGRDEALARCSKMQETQKNQDEALLRKQLAEFQQKHEAAIQDWQKQIEALHRRLDGVTKERDESQAELLRLREEQSKISASLKGQESAAASERDQLRNQLEAMERSHREQLAKLARERDEALAKRIQEQITEQTPEAGLKPFAEEQPAELAIEIHAPQIAHEKAFTLPLVRPAAPPPPVLRLHSH